MLLREHEFVCEDLSLSKAYTVLVEVALKLAKVLTARALAKERYEFFVRHPTRFFEFWDGLDYDLPVPI